MRILQIAPPWFTVPPTGYGGIEAIVARLCDGLVRHGHDVTLAASGGSKTSAELVTVFEQPPSSLLGDVAVELRHVLQAYRLASEGDFDVIHDHSGLIGPAIAAERSGPPVIHTLHGPWTPATTAFYRQIAERVGLVSISFDQARRRPADLPLFGVVPNGVDLDETPLRRRPPSDDDYLLFVGRANPEKGPVTAIEVARRTGRTLKMLIKVNEEPEREYWRREIEPLLHLADVQVQQDRGPQAKAELFAGAAATLCPLEWEEPFGLVMVESMAAGTPVIAYRRGAANDLVEDGVTGFLIDPGDQDAMVSAVARVTHIDPHSCRRHVAEHFSVDAMVRGYLQVFARATAAGRVSSLGTPITSIVREESEHSTQRPSVVRIPEIRAVPS